MSQIGSLTSPWLQEEPAPTPRAANSSAPLAPARPTQKIRYPGHVPEGTRDSYEEQKYLRKYRERLLPKIGGQQFNKLRDETTKLVSQVNASKQRLAAATKQLETIKEEDIEAAEAARLELVEAQQESKALDQKSKSLKQQRDHLNRQVERGFAQLLPADKRNANLLSLVQQFRPVVMIFDDQKIAKTPYIAHGSYGKFHIILENGELRALKALRQVLNTVKAKSTSISLAQAVEKEFRLTRRYLDPSARLYFNESKKKWYLNTTLQVATQRAITQKLDEILAKTDEAEAKLVPWRAAKLAANPESITAVERHIEKQKRMFEARRAEVTNLRSVLARSVVRQLAAKLAEMHADGVFHNDIKPDNNMLDRKGRIRPYDLGCAVERTGQEGEPVDLPFSTLEYSPPEFFTGEIVTFARAGRADVYRVGLSAAACFSNFSNRDFAPSDPYFISHVFPRLEHWRQDPSGTPDFESLELSQDRELATLIYNHVLVPIGQRLDAQGLYEAAKTLLPEGSPEEQKLVEFLESISAPRDEAAFTALQQRLDDENPNAE